MIRYHNNDGQDLEKPSQSLKHDLVKNLTNEYLVGHCFDQKVGEQNQASCQMEGVHEVENAMVLIQIFLASRKRSLIDTFDCGIPLSQKLRNFFTLHLGVYKMECHKYSNMKARRKRAMLHGLQDRLSLRSHRIQFTFQRIFSFIDK